MRYPLRRQILLPMLSLLAVTLLSVSLSNIWLSNRLLHDAIDQRMRDVAATLSRGTYPLQSNVLRQVQGLSGARLIITDMHGELLASSDESFSPPGRELSLQPPAQLQLRETEGDYFVAGVLLERPSADAPRRLLLYYPREEFVAAQRQAVVSSLWVGGAVLGLAVLFATMLAGRVTTPIRRLQSRVASVAEGRFQSHALPDRDDEIRDLAHDINRMASMLQALSDEKESLARLTTLHQLTAGIVHQLRNAATGCRIALDLFSREEPRWRDDERLGVAARQLGLIERYLERMLSMQKKQEPTPRQSHPLGESLEEAVALIRPRAEHLHVTIEFTRRQPDVVVRAEPALFEQAVSNLLLNALEACGTPANAAPRIRIDYAVADGHALITIADNGPGFAENVRERLGQPFVTSKPEGAGLGIAVARQIALRHGGSLAWRREQGWTEFVLRVGQGT